MMALPLSFLEVLVLLSLLTVFIVVSAKGLLFTEPCDPRLKLTGLVASVLVLLVPPNVIVVEADGTDVVVLLLLLFASVFNPNVGVLVGNDDDDDDDELPNEILLSVDFVSSLFCVLFELSAGRLVLVLLLVVVVVVAAVVVVPN